MHKTGFMSSTSSHSFTCKNLRPEVVLKHGVWQGQFVSEEFIEIVLIYWKGCSDLDQALHRGESVSEHKDMSKTRQEGPELNPRSILFDILLDEPSLGEAE